MLLAGAAGATALASLAGMAIFHPSIQQLLSALVAERNVAVERDVKYGPHERHALDIYRPLGDDATSPIAIFGYGGSWRYGHRSAYGFVGAAFAARGITAVVPDYRLYPEVKFPAFVEDIALAYVWVSRKFATKEGRPRPVVLVGHSAGAHLAALLAYDPHYLRAAGPDVPRPGAFVGLSGPYAFDPTTWPATAEVFATARSADEARPVAFVGPGAPPALLLHGSADDLVKVWNTRTLAETLAAHGVAARKIEFSGIGHLGILLAIARPLRWRAPVLDEIVTFIHGVKPAGAKQSLARRAP